MPNKSLRIAIADDEVDMRDLLQKVLPRWGHQIVCAAENGAELVDACRRTRPDLVITDLKMPGGDGVSAMIDLWRHDAIPAIIISAFPTDIPEWLSAHLLLEAVLLKPIKTADLEPIISRIASKP